VQQTPELDPLSATIAAFSLLVAPSLAPFAAAYSIIFFGAMVGVLIGLKSRTPSSRFSAISYIIVTGLTSIFMTVPLSDYLADHYEAFRGSHSWMFFPVSMFITAYGETWIKYCRDIFSILIKSFFKFEK